MTALAFGKAAGAAIASIAILYGAALLGLYLWQRHIIFPGAFLRVLPSGALPGSVASTDVFTADGERLRALWKPPRPGCGLVVTFHGNGSFPEAGAARFAAGPWARDGWGVLAIAYRGYPGSTGSPSEAGLIADGMAALADAKRRAPSSPVLLHGHSLGTAVAIAVAERDPHYAGLYLDAPFASVLALAQARLPLVPVAILLKDPFRSDLRIGHVHGPVVIIHGTGDGTVPIAEGRRLADVAPKGTVFEAVAGDHVSLLGTRDATWEPAFQRATGGCPAP
ncbi:MAG TPA: alpha/beta hydrolase [Lichenihabitans sp.]|nr:alpha/beta hydrolase [Lichenihabitans sp.]